MKSFKDLKEREMTDAEKKKREEIVLAMKDKKDEFKKKYGERWKEVMYATATKQAMAEAKEIDEISLKDLTNTISKSTGTKNIKTAMKPGEVKRGLDDLKKRLNTLGQSMQKEAKDPSQLAIRDTNRRFDSAKKSAEKDDENSKYRTSKSGNVFVGLKKEAKDPAEYDQEGDMVKSQLKTMIDAAQELHDQLGDDDNLPEWVQSKITKATDYIDSVRDYMKSEGDVNEELEEYMVPSKMSLPALRRKSMANRAPKIDDKKYADHMARNKKPKTMTSTQKSLSDISKRANEEKVDEISTPTLMRYRDKARQSANKAKNSAMAAVVRGDKDGYKRDTATMNKREKGLKNADRAAIRNTRKS